MKNSRVTRCHNVKYKKSLKLDYYFLDKEQIIVKSKMLRKKRKPIVKSIMLKQKKKPIVRSKMLKKKRKHDSCYVSPITPPFDCEAHTQTLESESIFFKTQIKSSSSNRNSMGNKLISKNKLPNSETTLLQHYDLGKTLNLFNNLASKSRGLAKQSANWSLISKQVLPIIKKLRLSFEEIYAETSILKNAEEITEINKISSALASMELDIKVLTKNAALASKVSKCTSVLMNSLADDLIASLSKKTSNSNVDIIKKICVSCSQFLESLWSVSS